MRHRWNINGEGATKGIIRLVLAGCACAGWYVSFRFSMMGFSAWKSGMDWAALCIVIFFTGLQILVNHEDEDMHPNLTLSLGGIISYGYGIITNVMGILAIGGTTLGAVWDAKQWWMIIFAACFGIPLELAPESMLMKAIFPNSRNMVSDAVQGLLNVFGNLFNNGEAAPRPRVSQMRDRNRQPSRSPLNPRWQNQQPAVRSAAQPEPTYHPVGMSNQFGERMDDLDDLDLEDD
jgi:hypothetical protein